MLMQGAPEVFDLRRVKPGGCIFSAGSARVLGALIVAAPWARLAAADIDLIVGLSFAGQFAVNHAVYLAGIRDTRW